MTISDKDRADLCLVSLNGERRVKEGEKGG
jgi:hypothetical protein